MASVDLITRRLQRRDGCLRSAEQVARPDAAEAALDGVQLRARGGQEIEVVDAGPQAGQRGVNHLAAMEADVVQPDHNYTGPHGRSSRR
jgi:hypothetical protein